MLLIGMFDSPFVRRVAITMKLQEVPFEHANWSIGRDFDRAENYLSLDGLVIVILGGIAVSSVTRVFVRQKTLMPTLIN